MRFLASAVAVLATASAVLAAPSEFVTGASAEHGFELMNQWKAFKAAHGKTYQSAELDAYRYSVFVRNLQRLEQLNAQRMGGPQYGITKFMDLEPEEFERTYLNYRPPAGQEAVDRIKKPLTRPTVQANPTDTSIDWTAKGATTAVKDQGACGSCWAFSAVAEVESMNFMKHGILTSLSEQQVVSCDKGYGDYGCQGGDTVSAYKYIQDKGLQGSSGYPYVSGSTGSDGTCKYNASAVEVKLSGFTYATPACFDSCKSQDEQTLLNNLVSNGPVSICVYASSWQFYSGGVFSDISQCPTSYTSLNHCVQLVGYQANGGYWIARNSWGTGWGEKGHIYLKYGSNMCGLADEATFATVV